MRARDVRAVVFCIVTATALMVLSYLALKMSLVTLALTGGYLAWLLTRPRMTRVMRRLRGGPDWSGYFKNQ